MNLKALFRQKLVLLLTAALIIFLPLKDGFLAAQQQDPAPNPDELIKQYKTSRFLERIKLEISSGESDLLSVNRQIEETEGQIDSTLEKIDTLQQQLDNLDRQIKASQKIIANVEAQIDLKESEIETMQYQIEQKKIEISFQKQMIAEYLKVIFRDQAEFNTLGKEGADLNTLKLLLSDETTSEKLRSIRYSEVLEEQGRTIFEKLGELIEEQETNQKILEIKKFTLIQFHQKLTEEKNDLEFKKKAKESLIEQTRGEEEIYRQLLARSKAQQEDVLLEIDTLRKNLIYVQDRIKELGDKFNPEDYASLLNVGNNKKLLEYLTYGLEGAEFSPAWPVNPVRGITAYYHEASYARLFGMQHNAVDVRAAQETPVKVAAEGIVYKAVDNGFGYSYVMVAHAGGFMTLYGHISKILVNEGDMLSQGDIIGLSGGIPGSKGAGVYTTGAHLHFEIIKDGSYEDPLNYLNLAFVDFASLPEKYVSKALGDQSKIRRMPLRPKIRNNSKDLAVSSAKVNPD